MVVFLFLIITNNPVVNDIKDAKVFFIDNGGKQVISQVYHQVAAVVHLFSPGITSDTINLLEGTQQPLCESKVLGWKSMI